LDTFCKSYVVKNNKIAKNSTTTAASEKYQHKSGNIKTLEKDDASLT
jgi:hypothetical protein